MIIAHTQTHLIVGTLVVRGPSNNYPPFAPARRQAVSHVRLARLLADAAYDGDGNHVLCRGKPGTRSMAIPLSRRTTGCRRPKTPYRRPVKRRFPKRTYGCR
jgi:hypothetical protein